MPKWWNKQQLCGTYTREAHTVRARTSEKGVHGKEGRVVEGGAYGKGGADGNGGRTAKGDTNGIGGAHGQSGGDTRTAKGRVRARP
jgi:hypothetical protein